MGPNALVLDILSKLETQFGQVTGSDMLFQNFYQMAQEKAEKIQTFAARLEGSLSQLRLRYP